MVIDTAFVSRIQFAFTISFHIIFPAFSIGMVTFLAVVEGMWLKTKKPEYLQMCKFWGKVFALTFGMGVVSGIVMEFQFGTNWAGFAHKVGGVLGGLFTYEVMTAFFIEAGFLGVMLFGWNKVGPKLHYFATLLVAFGTTLSAYWILVANTWMQHPVGFTEVNGIFEVASWMAIIFDASVFPRVAHMLLAAYLSTAFAISSICAYYLLKDRHVVFSRKCFSIIWAALIVLVPLQMFVGDWSGLMVHKTQPLKTAAMEAVWNTQKGAPFVLFAYPDQKKQKNLFAITIPHVAAMLNTHKWDGKLVGLKTVSRKDQPNVVSVFYGFRLMVGLGLLMLLMMLCSLWLRHKKKLYSARWFLHLCQYSAPIGFIALWCGWIVAEEGRQPWVVYKLLRTMDAASPVPLYNVIIVFALIILVYGVVFGFFYFYFLRKLIHKGPEEGAAAVSDQPFQYMSGSVSGDDK